MSPKLERVVVQASCVRSMRTHTESVHHKLTGYADLIK
jgi:hypothetical protein